MEIANAYTEARYRELRTQFPGLRLTSYSQNCSTALNTTLPARSGHLSLLPIPLSPNSIGVNEVPPPSQAAAIPGKVLKTTKHAVMSSAVILLNRNRHSIVQSPYPFALATSRPVPATAHGHATLHTYLDFVDTLSGASAQLGC